MGKERVLVGNRKQRVYTSWVLDLLIYTVILNLFVEYSAAIDIDSFTISLFTAFILKALLSVIIKFEDKIRVWFKSKDGTTYKVVGSIVTGAVLFLSKFLILEVIDFIFGQHVTIKGFIPLAVMILVMIATRKILEQVYRNL